MTEETSSLEPQNKLTRRNFFKSAISLIGAIITAGMGLPAIAYIVGPALKKESEQEWARLGAVSKVQIGEPTLFKFKHQVKTGWIVDEREISIYVKTDNGRDFVALSNVCTHLGCRVRWIAESKEFFCPCHNGVFDQDGNVTGGPPPRPLDQYLIKVENDQLYIQGG